MAEVGVAFVSIVPSARGFGAKLNSQVGPAAGAAGTAGGKKYGGAFKGAVGSALKGFGAIFAGAAIAGFAKNAIREASNLEESINAVNVSYGKSAAEILKIGQNSAKGFGLSKSEFNGFAVQFQSFSKTVAGAGGDVPKTFESIIGRARDFASVMNLDVKDAATLFQSGLAGETEPLRKFGIDLSAAAVKAHAYSEGIVKSGSELTENQKIQARYSLLMEKTNKTAGDFANTSGGLANQQRILKAQFANVSATVGAVVVPALAKFFTILTTKVGPAIKKVGQFIKDNSTTFKIIAGVIGALLIPSLIVATAGLVANTVAWVANSVAMGIATVWIRAYQIGAKIAAASTWLLNAALLVNPFVLIAAAVILLIAGLVLLVKKNEAVRKFLSEAWAKIKADLSAKWNQLKAKMASVWDSIKAKVRSTWDSIKAWIREKLIQIGVSVQNKIADIKKWFKELPGKIKAALGNLKDLLKQKGRDIINGLKAGIREKWNDLKRWFSDRMADLKSIAGGIFKSSSPSKVFMELGKSIGDGMFIGIKKSTPQVSAAVSMLATSAVGAGGTGIGSRFSAGNLATAGGMGGLEASLVGARVEMGKDGFATFVDGRVRINERETTQAVRFG